MCVALLVLPLLMLRHGNGNEEGDNSVVHQTMLVEAVVRNVEPSSSD